MNLPAFVRTLTDAELKTAIAELKVIDETGLTPEGLFRSLVVDTSSKSGVSLADAHKSLSSLILQVAAYKWAELDNSPAEFLVPLERLTPNPLNPRVQPITDAAQLVPGRYAIGFKSPNGNIDWDSSQVAQFVGLDHCCAWVDLVGQPIGAVLNIYTGTAVDPSAADAFLPKAQ